ncbi:MAG: C39 family peptidase [Lentisphaerae bacterium]|nr:C39 family peptidase [Lentisphaerota bacterium]
MKKTLWLALFLHTAAMGALADFSKFESFLDGEQVWETTPASFLASPRDESFFRWLSSKKDATRYPGYLNSPPMTFLGKKCWETVVNFDKDKLSDVTMSLYNRGDAGDMDDEKQYQAMLDAISGDIETWAGGKGVVLPRLWLANGKRLEKKVWVKNNRLAIELRWSASENIKVDDPKLPGAVKKVKFRAEYIQVVVSRFDPKNDPRRPPTAATPPKAATARDIRANVRTNAEGVVFIDNLPMVDQGQKGYCAVATTQRILGYYGADIDQHVIAQIADTATGGGTNPDDIIEMLKKLGVKFGVRVNVHSEFNVQKFVAFVNDYNQAAKRRKQKTIPLGQTIDVGAIYRLMDPAILKDTRCNKEKAGLRNFTDDITRHVNAGIPLAWGVMLGIVPETPAVPQASGGHMRIIFGYSKDKTEILYSDSWGAGHERKTMRLDDAWTITTGLYSFDPRK